MKSDTERKKFHKEKLHLRKNRLHVHISKELRSKLKTKTRAILIHKSDKVRVMRGPETGKEAKVSRVNTQRRKVYLEGMVVKNAKGREVSVPYDPSNLLLVGVEPTAFRKSIFNAEVFVKKAEPKAEKAAEGKIASEEDKKAAEPVKETAHVHSHDIRHEKGTKSEGAHDHNKI